MPPLSPPQPLSPEQPRPQRARAPRPRLTQPLVRKGGALVPVGWDEALDRAAAAFDATRRQFGPQAFGVFACSKASNEVNYLAQKFARKTMGSNNIDSCNRT